MQNITGQIARGDDYFPRENITGAIWDKLSSGNNLLLSAPRRVGKSSILNNLLEQPREGFLVTYVTTESVDSRDEFAEKLYNAVVHQLRSISRYAETFKKYTEVIVKSIGGVTADGGITLKEADVDYQKRLVHLIEAIDTDEQIVILIDEFAQTILNITELHGANEAVKFLQQQRELRMMPVKGTSRVQFVYAGSIGLGNVVHGLNSSKFINDLYEIDVLPLAEDEADAFINKIILSMGLIIETEAVALLKQKIEWYIPFYFQLIIGECCMLLRKTGTCDVDCTIVEQAFAEALKQKSVFDNWQERLRIAFKKNDFIFAKGLLNVASERLSLDKLFISNLADKYQPDMEVIEVIRILKHDGYVCAAAEENSLKFTSPLLKEWWRQNVAY